MKTKILSFFLLTLLLVSCDNNSNDYDKPVEVKFTSRIASSEVQTSRAANAEWAVNDPIGIYMKNSGEKLTDASIAEQSRNRKYKAAATSSNAAFAPATEESTIYFPADNAQKVDFIAYYPYTTSITSYYAYVVDVADQSQQAAIDLLYSNNVINRSSADKVAPLGFEHKLSKLILHVVKGEGVEGHDLNNMTVVFKNINTQASLALADGVLTIPAQASKDVIAYVTSPGAQYETILLPGNYREKKVEFRLNNAQNEVFVWTITTNDPLFDAGVKYTYTITLERAGGVSVTATISDWLEGPSGLTGVAN